MDGLFSSLTSIPVYFAFVPLGIIFIVLLILIVKSSIKVAPVQAVVPGTDPVLASAVPVNQTVPVSPPATAPPAPAVAQQAPQVKTPDVSATVPLVQESSSLPHVEPSPSPTPVPPQTYSSPVSTGAVPPVSSWKPVPQVAISENVGISELQMQAQAAAHENVVPRERAPRVSTPVQSPTPTVVDIISEPVVTPSVATPVVNDAPVVSSVQNSVQAPVPVIVTEPIVTPVPEVTPATPPTPEVVTAPAPLVTPPAPVQEPVPSQVEVSPALSQVTHAEAVPEVVTPAPEVVIVPVTQAVSVQEPTPLPTEAIKA